MHLLRNNKVTLYRSYLLRIFYRMEFKRVIETSSLKDFSRENIRVTVKNKDITEWVFLKKWNKFSQLLTSELCKFLTLFLTYHYQCSRVRAWNLLMFTENLKTVKICSLLGLKEIRCLPLWPHVYQLWRCFWLQKCSYQSPGNKQFERSHIKFSSSYWQKRFVFWLQKFISLTAEVYFIPFRN